MRPIGVSPLRGHRKVVKCGGASMLAGDDVIDLEGEPVMRIRDSAILATMTRSLPDLLNQEWVY